MCMSAAHVVGLFCCIVTPHCVRCCWLESGIDVLQPSKQAMLPTDVDAAKFTAG